jgi:hypothetical protein
MDSHIVGMDSHIVGMHFHILGAPVGGHGFSDLLSVVCFSVILRPLVRCLGRSRRCCAMLYSGASIWECIPIYWDAHIYGNAFPYTGGPSMWECIPRYWGTPGSPSKLECILIYRDTPVSGHALPHTGHPSIWECTPIFQGIPVYENAFPYTRIPS